VRNAYTLIFIYIIATYTQSVRQTERSSKDYLSIEVEKSGIFR